jgi:hypothetical protein
VAYAGRPLRLTPTEIRVLQYLLVHAGAVVPTRTLLEAGWGREHAVRPDVVRVTMHCPQRKLCNAGARNLLGTVHGVGVVARAEQSYISEDGGPGWDWSNCFRLSPVCPVHPQDRLTWTSAHCACSTPPRCWTNSIQQP